MDPPVGSRLGRYELVERLGRGGMATVYRAADPLLGREVALKFIPRALLADEMLLERYRREARTVARLDHPAILSVHDIGDDEEGSYVVMPLLTGGSLRKRLDRGGLTVGQMLRVVQRVAEALDYAHSLGIVHRDLKPSNILFDDDGNSYLADFGIAKLVGAGAITLTGEGMTVGTPTYMAPEQGTGEEVGAATDQYALAVTAFEMLAGRPPFSGASPMAVLLDHINKPPPHFLLTPAVYDALANALGKRQADRYASASAFAAALESAVNADGLARDEPPVYPGTEPAPDEEATRESLPVAGSEDVTAAQPIVVTPKSPPSALSPLRSRGWIGAAIAIPVLILVAIGSLVFLFGGGDEAPTAVFMPLAIVIVAGTAVFGAIRWSVARSRSRSAGRTGQVDEPEPPPLRRPEPQVVVEPPRGRPHAQRTEQQLGAYRLIDRIDKGGRTRVYHAIDTKREREVALKVIDTRDESGTRAARFDQEARLLGRLHHAHIVPFFDFGSANGVSYIAMPLLAGRSLAARLEVERVPLEPALRIVGQVAGALDYLHAQGIVHRDLKPSNLVFDEGENVYLADLGIAKVLDDEQNLQLTQVGQILGTPAYMPPEQWLGGSITPAADEYALACIAFEMLSGVPPFVGDSPYAMMLQHVKDTPPLLSNSRPDLPGAIDAVLLHALEKDAQHRHGSTGAMAAALQLAAAGSVEPATAGTGHVFISYSQSDGEFARQLADRIRAAGLDVWMDARIEPSDRWWRVIVDAIEACGAFVVVMSSASEGSRWVEREILLADRTGKPAFPVLLGGDPFPIYIGTQYAEAVDGALPPAFYERLARTVGGT